MPKPEEEKLPSNYRVTCRVCKHIVMYPVAAVKQEGSRVGQVFYLCFDCKNKPPKPKPSKGEIEGLDY